MSILFKYLGLSFGNSNKIKGCIKEILKLVSIIRRKRKKVLAKYDNDSLIFAATGALQINKINKDLEEYLMTLDDNTLLRIVAAMFYGKFSDASLMDKYDMCVELAWSKKKFVHVILTLIPDCDLYFKEALRKAKKEGIDLNNF